MQKLSISAILLLWLKAASAFQSTKPAFVSSTTALICQSKQQAQQSRRQQKSHLYNSEIALIDAALPGILFAGAAAATILQDDFKDAPWAKNFLHRDEDGTAAKTTTVSTTTVLRTNPTVTKVETKVVAPAAPAEPTPVPVASPPGAAAVAITLEPPAAAKPTLTAKDVASTVQEQRQTLELVEQKKQKLKQQMQQEQQSPVPSTTTTADDESASTSKKSFEAAPAKGKKRKLAVRFLKKVVAPWRKWETIN
jgi:hypothetical protein